MRAAMILRGALAAGAVWLASTGAAQACIGLGCTCGVSAQNTAFGVYNPFAASPNDAVGQVSVNCGAQVAVFFSYDVKLSTGGGGAYASRRMISGANQIGYQLYTDAARSTVWGDGTASTGFISNSYTLSISLLSRTDNFSVYGRAPANQNVKVGSYTDTITVTVTF